MTIRKIYSFFMIGLLLFGIGYPATGAWAEEGQDDQFSISEARLTNENTETIEEVDAEKQINAKFHLKMTGKQARENDGTVIALSGTDSLTLPTKQTEFAPEIAGVKADTPLVTFQVSDELNGYALKWDKEDFESIADDQEIDYEVTLPLTIQTITEDFKANIEMKFSGLKENVKFGLLTFKAPVKSANTESEVKATEKKLEATKEEKQNSEETETDPKDEADSDTDEKTENNKSQKIGTKVLTNDPMDQLNDAIAVSQVGIKQNAFSSEFEIWSKDNSNNQTNINIYENKSSNGQLSSLSDLQNNYYDSYHKNADEQKSSIVTYSMDYNFSGEEIGVYYGNVGLYTDLNHNVKTMGAVVKITNIQDIDNDANGPWGSGNTAAQRRKFIDFSNNLYSGVTYGNIGQFNIDITFIDPETKERLQVAPQTESIQSYLTFGSLNGDREVGNEWVGSAEGVPGLPGKLVEKHEDNMYEGIGEGVWDGSSHSGDHQWGDYLGSVDFEDGAVSFPLLKTSTHKFILKCRLYN
ncbi:hypothetical protein ACLJJ6_09425 [Pediococcus siamensis]|uniref:hypothetical protein n=1 Tax=Pediococcus siamensis TaxID=381829 RepID=UPI0039A0BCD1